MSYWKLLLSYFSIFQQIIGIPMGPKPVLFFANLFLFYNKCNIQRILRKKMLYQPKVLLGVICDLISIKNQNIEKNVF